MLAKADGWPDNAEVDVSYGSITGTAELINLTGIPVDPDAKPTKALYKLDKAPVWCRYIAQAALAHKSGLTPPKPL